MIHELFDFWRALSKAYRMYAIGVLIYGTAFINILISRSVNSYSTFATLASAIFFGAGFIFWMIGWLGDSARTTRAKWALGVLHVVILYFSAIPARIIVAKAIGLPPQDFDMTVHILAIILYPLVWIFLIAAGAAALGIVMLMSAGICALTTYGGLNETLIFLSKVLPKQSQTRTFIEEGRNAYIRDGFLHSVGACVVAITCMGIWDFGAGLLTRNPGIVRWVAYVVDYQEPAIYPGVDKGKRLRLHENGVVSYAEFRDWKIGISTGEFKQSGLGGQ